MSDDLDRVPVGTDGLNPYTLPAGYYVTETWSSSWGGNLGRGSLEQHLNEVSEKGWELVTATQILHGHDFTGEVGLIWTPRHPQSLQK
jgi:hypothetical protein